MNEIEVLEIKQIELEINFYKEQAAKNIIEIGKRLIKAKGLVEHGEWESWLDKKIDFRQTTATKYMRVAREFPNIQSLEDLGQTKIFTLLELPASEREAFIKDNQIEDMTTRELRQAIKEKKELNELKEKLEKDLSESEYKHNNLLEENRTLKNREPQIIEKEVVKEVVPEHIKIQISQLEETKSELEKLQRQSKEMNNYSKAKSNIEEEIKSLSEKKYEQQQAYEEMTILADKARQSQSIETARKRLIRRIEVSTDDLRKQRYSIEELFKEVGDVGEEAKRRLIKEAEFLEEMSSTFRQMADSRNIINTNYEIIEGDGIYGE